MPSSLRSTSRHFGYFLFRTNSSHWGIEARAIWIKNPAWSIDSVSGAVRTISLPPLAEARRAKTAAFSEAPFRRWSSFSVAGCTKAIPLAVRNSIADEIRAGWGDYIHSSAFREARIVINCTAIVVGVRRVLFFLRLV